MNSRPPIMTFTPTASEPPRRASDFLQPLARRVDQKPMAGSSPQPEAPRRLSVARGITLRGELLGCQRLTVEGSVEATLTDCQVLEVAEHGSFGGKATVEQAEVRGRVDGDLTVLGRLVVRATGRVSGKVRYQEVIIEQGGKLAGQIELLTGEPEAGEGEPAVRVQPRFALAAASEGAASSDDGGR
ncbi:MAG TPA: polymer-forming cytoskeletal protein [Kiloniellales bacterium]|nr:polymer-forming cytoskeletal protein [Kiloniellales bacterium]